MKKIVLLFVFSVLLLGCVQQPTPANQSVSVVVIIDNGFNSTNYSIQASVGESALSVLELVASVEKEEYPIGVFVYGINGVKSSGSQSWIYYVDGELAPLGVSAFKITKSVVILFKLQEPPDSLK